jgi:formiminotetrahydrofolate cyclodeaminase
MLMLIEMPVKEFLDQTASSSPAPGGGSASALAGSLGAALAEMVINLTIGKKKYAEVSEELAALLPRLTQARLELQALVDKDTEAFNLVMKAFGMPKESEDQVKARSAAIQEATIKATEVPLSVMRTALSAMDMTLTVAKKGNRKSASDAGVAGLFLSTAMEGAALNVKINLPGLPDELEFKQAAEREMNEMLMRKTGLAEQIQAAVGL